MSRALSERDAQIAERDAQIAERDAQIARLAQEVDALRNSMSWRLTKPLRFIGQQIARGQISGQDRTLRISNWWRPAWDIRKSDWSLSSGRPCRDQAARVQAAGEVNPVVGSGKFDRNDYTEWVRRYDTIDDAKRQIEGTLCGIGEQAEDFGGDAHLQPQAGMADRGHRVGQEADLPELGALHRG